MGAGVALAGAVGEATGPTVHSAVGKDLAGKGLSEERVLSRGLEKDKDQLLTIREKKASGRGYSTRKDPEVETSSKCRGTQIGGAE